MSFDGLLDTAFEQIRHYAVADIAVSLRLLRAFTDLTSATQVSSFRTRHFWSAPDMWSMAALHIWLKTSWKSSDSALPYLRQSPHHRKIGALIARLGLAIQTRQIYFVHAIAC